MARTHGHGNPDWSLDETILALELYLQGGRRAASKGSPDVIELSRELQALPFHKAETRRQNFRNADGVAFKVNNLRSLDVGRGLGNVSEVDRVVWARYGNEPDEVKRLAARIRASIAEEPLVQAMTEEEPETLFIEGAILTAWHKRYERHPDVRRRLLGSRRLAGSLTCEMCGFVPRVTMSGIDDAFFEAHHLLPLSSAMERKTSVRDLALLCANCHHALHRAIALSQRWLSPDEAKEVIFG